MQPSTASSSAAKKDGWADYWICAILACLALVAGDVALRLLRDEIRGPRGGVELRFASHSVAGVKDPHLHMQPLSWWMTGENRYALARLNPPPGQPLEMEFELPAATEGFLEIQNGGAESAIAGTVRLEGAGVAAEWPLKVAAFSVGSPASARAALRTEGPARIRISVSPAEASAPPSWIKLASIRVVPGSVGEALPAGAQGLVPAAVSPGDRAPRSGWSALWWHYIQALRGTGWWYGAYAALIVVAGVLFVRSRSPVATVVVIGLFTALSLLNLAVGLGEHGRAFGMDFTTYAALEGSGTGNLYYAIESVRAMRLGQVAQGLYNVQRMPGYFVFCWIPNALFRTDPADFLAMYKAVVIGHAAFWILALAVLGWRLSRLDNRIATVAILAVAGTRTINLQHVQVDTVVLPCWLLFVAAIAPALSRRHEAAGNWRPWAAHTAMFFLCLLRSEFYLLWAAAALLVPGAKGRNLAVMVLGVVAISLFQGSLARANGEGFKPRTGTLTTGHVAFVGLWQNNFHPFVWEPADASYDRWISAHGYRYNSAEAAHFATPEIIRFYLTFPLYTFAEGASKYGEYWRDAIGGGELERFAAFPDRQIWLHKLGFPILLLGLAGCLVTRSRGGFMLLLPVLISLPIFCLIQFSRRYLQYVDESLLLAGVVAVIDPGFWRTIPARWKTVLAVVVLGWAGAWFLPKSIAWVTGDQRRLLWDPVLHRENSTLFRLKSDAAGKAP